MKMLKSSSAVATASNKRVPKPDIGLGCGGFSVGFPEPTLLPANQVVMAMFLRTCCATQHAASDLLDTAVHGHAACFLWLRSNRPELTTGHTIKPHWPQSSHTAGALECQIRSRKLK